MIWLCSTNESRWSNGEEFDSREAAIAYGHTLASEDGADEFWIGTKGEFKPYIDGNSIIESISEQAMGATT